MSLPLEKKMLEAGEREFRILLADDSQVERLAMAQLLRGAGYEVDEAADGKAALLLLQHGEVDMLLLDLEMPNLNGFEVLSYLQKHRPRFPVLLLSGLAPNEIQGGIHTLPMQELPTLLFKPVDGRQLLELVELRMRGELP